MARLTIEDVYVLITEHAMAKMPFLENDDIYTADNGKEYHKWDVPVFIMLNGVAYGASPALIFNNCIAQMSGHVFSPDHEVLNKILETVIQKCNKEMDALRHADARSDADVDPVEIFNEIKFLISQS